jgi:hypothetical protein
MILCQFASAADSGFWNHSPAADEWATVGRRRSGH